MHTVREIVAKLFNIQFVSSTAAYLLIYSPKVVVRKLLVTSDDTSIAVLSLSSDNTEYIQSSVSLTFTIK